MISGDLITIAFVLALPLLGFLAGANLIYGGVKKYAFAQKIKNAPISKVTAAVPGLIKLYGKAQSAGPLISPISKTRCAFWRIVAEYKPGKYVTTLFSRDSAKQINLKDETGVMPIEPGDGEFEIPCHAYNGCVKGEGLMDFGSGGPLPQEVMEFINDLDPVSKNLFMSNKNMYIWIREYCIAEGDGFYVVGNAESGAAATSAGAYGSIIIRKRKPEDVLAVSDSEEKLLKGDMPFIYLALGVGIVLFVGCGYALVMILGI